MGFIECTRHQKVANVLVLQKKTCSQSGNSARNTPATGGDTPRAHRHATSANGCVDGFGKRSFAGLGADGGDSDTCT
jgi:hypothetical protein